MKLNKQNPGLEFSVSFSLEEETRAGLRNNLFIIDEIQIL